MSLNGRIIIGDDGDTDGYIIFKENSDEKYKFKYSQSDNKLQLLIKESSSYSSIFEISDSNKHTTFTNKVIFSDSTTSVPKADQLTNSVTIGGLSFNGTQTLNLPGVNITGNQDTSGTSNFAKQLKLTGLTTSEISNSANAISNIVSSYVDQNDINTGVIWNNTLNRNILWKGSAANTSVWSLDQWILDEPTKVTHLDTDYPIMQAWIPYNMKPSKNANSETTDFYHSNIKTYKLEYYSRETNDLTYRDNSGSIDASEINQANITAQLIISNLANDIDMKIISSRDYTTSVDDDKVGYVYRTERSSDTSSVDLNGDGTSYQYYVRTLYYTINKDTTIYSTSNSVRYYNTSWSNFLAVSSQLKSITNIQNEANWFKNLASFGYSGFTYNPGSNTLKVNNKLSIGSGHTPEAALDIRSGNTIENSAKNIYIDCNNYNNTTENGLIWKPNYGDYTKKSAGILFKPEADAYSGGLVFYTNNSQSSGYSDTGYKTQNYYERMHLDMNGNLELKSGTLNIVNSTSTNALISLKRTGDSGKINIKLGSIDSDKDITFPNKTGTICLSASGGLELNSTTGDMTLSSINNLAIGATTPSTGNFTTLLVNNGLTVASGQSFNSDTVNIDGGAIDGTAIGANSASTGNFTGLSIKNTSLNSILTLESDRNSNVHPKARILFKTPDGSSNYTTSSWEAAQIESGWDESSSAWNKSYIKFQTHNSSSAFNDTLILKGGDVELSSSGKSTTVKGTLNVNDILTVNNNGSSLKLIGTDHTLIDFFPNGSTTRKGYLGFPTSTDSNLTLIRNNDELTILGKETSNNYEAHLMINNAGNVWIGTNKLWAKNNSNKKLYVKGDFHAEGEISASSNISGGILTGESNGQSLKLIGTDHTYIDFFRDGGTTRGAYIGFPTATDTHLVFMRNNNSMTIFGRETSSSYTAHLMINNAGNVWIGSNVSNASSNSSKKLYVEGDVEVNGDFEASGEVKGTSWDGTSDDRLKHNEKDISNALDTIMKLNPKTYFKTKKLFANDHNFTLNNNNEPITDEEYTLENGLIAQDLLNIDELKYTVGDGDYLDDNGKTIERAHTVRYNDVFVYNIKATQELYNKNIELENRILQLEQQVQELLKKVN